ncbi:DNA-binding transcriptional activator of the SARP family [Peptoniphilus asaccharolyticus DSM 20463]|uniref:DNA-binding transcriptional activator of the SARP family n=1 Tax=Peptoniphilus asaccharolyticus DSM 20463 TaxID=573058 RepID=A0A1W1V8T9_PEPAS|nr:BTAD domain-containing putative transcriptional regulator [Peptoniphilus asaccharolyticus]MBL7575804.1 AAA family ATPase [Peptoniphilus asaccharolyticus]SMB89849.1 DNA-binding transcriptional activator of the SARP family [Peptoniphilus asaccharolyticus DSM 20463]
MDKIYLQLFGVPQFYLNGEQILFPYSKINALIYYLILNKFITRDEIANLLWPDENEKTAKKNLRNAIYQAKKCVGIDFIISPKKSVLEIDKNLDIQCDADLFNQNPIENLDLYKGEFLQGFFIKEAESYEYWVTKMRNYFEEKFISTSYDKLEKDIAEEKYENVEKEINKLTQIDEYDERNFRLLMKFYQKTGRNGKVIETYYNLTKLLQDELGVSPDLETKEIYEESIKRINLNNKRPKSHDEYFFGRFDELAAIQENLKSLNTKTAKSIVLYGEAGIGKSALKRKAFEQIDVDTTIVESFCYQAEENYALRPIGVMIEKIGKLLKEFKIPLPTFWDITIKKLFPAFEDSAKDIIILENKHPLNFDLLTQVIVEAIKKISAKQNLILIFEDIQWMDQTSIKLLTSVILRLNKEAMFFMTSRRQFNRDVEDMVSTLIKYDLLEKIELDRFSRDDTAEFISKALPEVSLEDKLIDKIYSETEGNSFFLSEYINLLKSSDAPNLMTPEMMDSMKSRFAYLSKPERDLLDIVSYFYDEAPLSQVTEISGQGEFDIIGLLENLENANILTEREHKDDTGIMFTHSKLREYIYMTQANSKKKVIHKRIGQLLEANLKNDKSLYTYSKLVYHYSSAGENLKSIKYKLETLNYYLNFSHELFPILNVSELDEDAKIYISRDKIQEMFDKLEENFSSIKKAESEEDAKQLEIEFYYMKGRYLIRDGSYQEGLEDIKYVIEKAKEIGNKDYILDGYKQMIFYNIQTNNSKDMLEYIESALDLAVICNYHKEIGILLRLKGLYNMMIGNTFLAEKLFTESINTFTVTDEVANRYAINIAAAYNYIGEIRFQDLEFKEAIGKFEKAIELSKNKSALSSLSIFYINKGKAHFANNELELAKEEFNKAYTLYGQFDSFWKRPVLDSYMALCEVEDKNYKNASAHLRNAFEFAATMEDPRALGTVYFAGYRIFKELDQDILNDEFVGLFTEKEEFYREKAIENLDANRDKFEISNL